jgi:SAM-dependent methyltransferase
MLDAHRATAYMAAITQRTSDLHARRTFQSLVTQLAAPGAWIFDFGCGPGIDAKVYVAHGFRVSAYDHDPVMCELAAARCRGEIQSGRLRLHGGDYRGFLSEPPLAAGSIGLVTANFAPFNLIVDLPELFAALDRLLGPEGKVLVSVLSPYFLGDLKYGWWWRHLGALLRRGEYAVSGERGPIIRRRLATYARAAAPHFRLRRLWRGDRASHWLALDRGRRPGPFDWLPMSSCRFMFLLFTRPHEPA